MIVCEKLKKKKEEEEKKERILDLWRNCWYGPLLHFEITSCANPTFIQYSTILIQHESHISPVTLSSIYQLSKSLLNALVIQCNEMESLILEIFPLVSGLTTLHNSLQQRQVNLLFFLFLHQVLVPQLTFQRFWNDSYFFIIIKMFAKHRSRHSLYQHLFQTICKIILPSAQQWKLTNWHQFLMRLSCYWSCYWWQHYDKIHC